MGLDFLFCLEHSRKYIYTQNTVHRATEEKSDQTAALISRPWEDVDKKIDGGWWEYRNRGWF